LVVDVCFRTWRNPRLEADLVAQAAKKKEVEAAAKPPSLGTIKRDEANNMHAFHKKCNLVRGIDNLK